MGAAMAKAVFEPAMPAIAPAAGMEISEESLARRFSRPERKSVPLVYELTHDAGYLHQYARLLDKPIPGDGDVLIARIGNHVIGGCRLTFSYSKDRQRLPMESTDCRLQQQFPDLPLRNVTYAEVSDMAVFEEYRQRDLVMDELVRRAIKRCTGKQACFVFALTPLPQARAYQHAAAGMALHWKLRKDIAVPDRREYDGVNMLMSVLDLAPVQRPVRKLQTTSKTPASLVGA